jgi:MoxR-like ATPase
MDIDISRLNDQVNQEMEHVQKVKTEIGKVIVGQQEMIDRLLITLFTNGHVLIEGVPGLAKTLTVTSLAKAISADSKRIQFTPDLLPADLIGTLIYNQKTGDFTTKKGPIFTNILLADEINRAPSKVQSALLECMQERQVTIGDTTFQLQEPFIVLATENPIEQEGTYPLPEAQVDRFMLKLKITYPTKEEEKVIVKHVVEEGLHEIQPVISMEKVLQLRDLIKQIYIDEKVVDYILDIVAASRYPQDYKIDPDLITYGASPRASIFLALAGKARAFLQGRGYVTPEDIRVIGADVLRHRIILSYEAEAEDKDADEIIQRIFNTVEVP